MSAVRTIHPATEPAETLAWLRGLARRAGIPVIARARLLLATADVIRAAHALGHPVRITTRVESLPTGQDELVVSLSSPAGNPVGWLSDQALPPTVATAGELAWRIPAHPVPAIAAPAAPADEEELRAAIDMASHDAGALAELDAEMAETNRGVLSLYTELQDRDRQLRTAHGVIFQSLEDALRPPPPVVPGVQFGVAYRPAQASAPTGGDLYDWQLLPNGDLQITVVDVVGHGVQGTRDALNVTHTLRILALQDHPLPTLIGEAAALLQPAFPDLMATVLAARLTVSTGQLHLAGGSHLPLLLAQPGQPPCYLPSPGRGIGYPEPGTRTTAHATLRPGAIALLYTDGLVEATRNITHGMNALLHSAELHRHHSPDQLTELIVSDLHQDSLHSDDTLLLALRWNPVQSPRPGSTERQPP